MANIFQQSLAEIPVQGYVPTTQRDTATPELISTIGQHVRAIDVAREESLLKGNTGDELPTYDTWQYQEVPGPVRPGEAPPVMPIRTEVFDATAELNLNQIVRARQQGLLTPSMAEVRANAALRRAVNRRPGRQGELTQAYNDFLGLYSGISEETAAEQLASDQAKRQAAIDDHFIKKFGMEPELGRRWQQEQTIQEMQEFRTDVPSRSAADMYAIQAETIMASRLNQIFSNPNPAIQQQELAQLQIDFASMRGEFLNRYGQMARDAGWKDDYVRKDQAYLSNRIDGMMKQMGDTNLGNMFSKGMNAIKGYGDIQAAQEWSPIVWSITSRLSSDDNSRLFAVAERMRQAGINTPEYEKIMQTHKWFGEIADMMIRGKSVSATQNKIESDIRMMQEQQGMEHPMSMSPQTAGQLSNSIAGSPNTPANTAFELDTRTINLGLNDARAFALTNNQEFKKRVDSNPALKNYLIRATNSKLLELQRAIGEAEYKRAMEDQAGFLDSLMKYTPYGAASNIIGGAVDDYIINGYRQRLKSVLETQKYYGITSDTSKVFGNDVTQNNSKKNSKISTSAVEFIAEKEGYRNQAYQDSGGVWTIGYGTTNGVNEGDVITEDQARASLTKDIELAERAIDEYVTVPLTPNQRIAVASLIYNIGVGAFKSSESLKRLNNGDYKGFAEGVFGEHGFVNVKGKRNQGLVSRRLEERALFEADT